ncbi:MAG: hypothetical protein HY943_01265 [Gammaproteobacteria bacterium]|nr:hypothetical protein [Gammaproteobacteria bacterium]
MKIPLFLSAALLALGMQASQAAEDVTKDLTDAPADAKGRRCHMHEMMGGGPHGMGPAMMGPGMMGGPMIGGHMGQMIMVPRLPAGNEKLEIQMHAEMLQKIGEIEAKYAGQLK